jgi:hypothetical protein
MYGYRPELEHVFSYCATLHTPFEVLGETPDGLRINAYLSGGEVRGPRMRGRVRPVGADWLTVRPDGTGVLDVRATIESDDGALVYLAYGGIIDLGEDGLARMLAGNPPARAPIRAAPRFLTAHPDYVWLNRLQCVNIGEADFAAATVYYDVYALR